LKNPIERLRPGRAFCLRWFCPVFFVCVLAGCQESSNPPEKSAGSEQKNTVVLKVAHFLPAGSNAHANIIGPWCEDLQKDSQGRIRCQIYPSLQLGGTAATLVDQVQSGVADIVWTAPGYSAGRFPRVEVLELPFLLPYGGMLGNRLIWRFYQEHATEDFAGYKVLALFGDGGQDIHLRTRPVTRLEDFQALKIRASSRSAAKTLEALGATPVSMPPAQMTESISKGVVDGAMAAWEVVPPTKLDEVTRHHSAFSQGQPALGYTVLAMLMNQKRYDSLPDDLKAILDRHAGLALVERFGSAWDRFTEQARALAPADSLFVVEADEYARWQQAVQPVADEWVKEGTARGIHAQALLEAAQQLHRP